MAAIAWPIGLQAFAFLRRELSNRVTHAKFVVYDVRMWLCDRLNAATNIEEIHEIAGDAITKGAISRRDVDEMLDEGFKLDKRHGYV
ncbi:hypothetical protein A2118_00555 [Candidatus Kaiserbacteria bacterium GWA2_50_9]|uniref:Uncharacterized protein n=1 Tax=Candidatus Kaiserbacteria bacterium GWA2_50_9 TaxID=1798474 RepID=A0A1F6BW98_9BACT|nr:MAG: hypothetical protein A2118_00555 [Candidatus Kaiserbacteria bacterium GWA2_50_9]